MRFPALPAQAVQYGRGDERIEFVEAVEGQHRDLHVKTPAKNDGPKGPRLYRAFEDIINPARPRGVSRKRSAQRDRQLRARHDVRSEERRVGKEYARTVRSRWSP